MRKTLVIEDPRGAELITIQDRRCVCARPWIQNACGATAAIVKKAMLTPLRERFTIELGSGGQMNAQGIIVDHEFEIESGGAQVAEVSKEWFRARDSYGVEIAAGQDEALILAITMRIDQMVAG